MYGLKPWEQGDKTLHHRAGLKIWKTQEYMYGSIRYNDGSGLGGRAGDGYGGLPHEDRRFLYEVAREQGGTYTRPSGLAFRVILELLVKLLLAVVDAGKLEIRLQPNGVHQWDGKDEHCRGRGRDRDMAYLTADMRNRVLEGKRLVQLDVSCTGLYVELEGRVKVGWTASSVDLKMIGGRDSVRGPMAGKCLALTSHSQPHSEVQLLP
ncbi:hypothetical protein B0H14DRAFT_2635658 [Mycena olivaceomarginata]|nr:hypothetical protein B0H14DRAFT_2635658 [Mycena olivaceomarginata]